MKDRKLFLIILLIVTISIPLFFRDKITKIYLKYQIKPVSYLSYQDLLKLSKESKPSGLLYSRLQKQLTTPYVSNRLFKLTNTANAARLYIRVAHWNIQKGKNVDAIKNLLSKYSGYYYSIKKNTKEKRQANLMKELRDFASSDIIALNEVDIGLPQTNYRNIISELAKVVDYNYAYATEFVEVGPLRSKIKIDPKRYLGLHGNAILSRYPIKSARILRLPEYYKWYDAEVKSKSPLEYGRRISAKTIFRQQILSEVRHGNRCALIVEIELPTKEILTVVSTHLEDKCYPEHRFKQAKYLFGNLKFIRTPLVIAGDFNTSTTDSAPTSFKKEIGKRIRDPHFIARQFALALLVPGFPPGVGNLAAATINAALHYKDPAAINVPVLFPNKERELFMYLKDFRFTDGESFDFGGEPEKSSNGKGGLLANSNERQFKGFESTFKFEEPRLVAYFKLDWFFVKPKKGRFEPFNGQTLKLVNKAFGDKVSDHDPIIVDLAM